MKVRQVFLAYNDNDIETDSNDAHCLLCGTQLAKAADSTHIRQQCPRCGWTYYKNPLPGVVALIIDGSKVLLGKRMSEAHGAGKWCLPGGFIEWNENFLSAAIREVKEETGLKVEIESILSVVSNYLSQKLHTLVVVLKAKIIEGVPVPGDDIVELRWFGMTSQLPNMAFEADQHIIQRIWKTNLVGIPVDQDYSCSE